MAFLDPDSRARRLAARQYGLITRAQARALGLIDRQIRYRLARGDWVEARPGVYRVGGAPQTWHQDLMAAHLWAGETSAISHRAAAALLGIEGFKPGIVELSTPSKKVRSPKGMHLHLVSRLELIDVTNKGGIPVTTIIRTLVDLGTVVDREKLECALDFVLRTRKSSILQLRKHLDRLAGHGRGGAGVLRRILDDREKMPTESTLERRFLRLVKASRLPLPQSQVRMQLYGGNYRLDFVWESHRLVVECEGYYPHSRPEMFESDRLRRNRLTVAGWRVLHFTWKEVTENPNRVLATLCAALGTESLSV